VPLDRGAARATTLLLVLVVVLLVLLAVLLFPTMLGSLGGPTSHWERLSFIAQVVSAAIGLAGVITLVAVVGAFWFQAREYRAAREQAVRAEHRELLKIAMDRPELDAVWGGPADPGLRDQDPAALSYAVMIVDFWQMAYVGGATRSAEVRLAAKRFFAGRIGRAFWKDARADRAESAGTRAERRFHELVEEEYAAALRVPPAPDEPLVVTAAPRPESRPAGRGGTAGGGALAAGAAAGAAAVVVSYLLGRRRR
jgi:hypothetical protein